MKKNMGPADRIIRLIISAVISTLYFTNVIDGTFGLILMALAAIFALTSFISFCPLYRILGLSTCAVKK